MMEQQGAALDLPLITEATNEFYRQVYGNNDLGPIFKGVNMVVLRRHVSYFILQLTAFDTPMTEPQIDFLRKVHGSVIEERGATQRHFDILVSLLITSLRSAGAQGTALLMVQSKLRPLRDIFPLHATASASGSQAGSSLNSVDGTIVLHEGGSNSRDLHANHSKPQQRQERRQQQQQQQQMAASVAASQMQCEASAQQQQQQRHQEPCAGCMHGSGDLQQRCCQHSKQQGALQQQLQQQKFAAPAAAAEQQAMQQQQDQEPQQSQQQPACCAVAKQVAPAAVQQQKQLFPPCMSPAGHQQLQSQQQQQLLQQQKPHQSVEKPPQQQPVPRQPWYACFAFCR